jgi:hypothetical protein
MTDASPLPPISGEDKLKRATALIEKNLTTLMESGESESSRVAAARALMDLVKYMNGENDKARQSDDKARMEAIRDARSLLAEFAALKFGSATDAGVAGADRPAEVDQGGKAEPDHAAG